MSRTSVTPSGRARHRLLSPEEQEKLEKVKGSLTYRIVSKLDESAELTPEQRDNAKLKDTSVGSHLMDLSENAGDLAANTLDAVSGGLDYVGGGKSRNMKMVGKEAFEEKWGDNSLQSEGVPIGSAAAKGLKAIKKSWDYAKDMIEFAKANKKLADGTQETTTEEKLEVLQKTVDLFLSYLDLAASGASIWTTALGTIPIVGAFIGALTNGFSFAFNMLAVIKAFKSVDTMRAQRKEAKDSLGRRTAALGSGERTGDAEIEDGVRTGGFLRMEDGKEKVHVTSKTVKEDAAIKEKYGKKVERKRRMDEFIKTHKAREDVNADDLKDLEDYDVAKELGKANKRRRKQRIIDMVLRDGVGFGAALAAIDPTGLGATIGASINGAVSLGYLGKDVALKGRQYARNRGLGNADVNKSDANKLQRRHNLAVIQFDRLMELRKKYFLDDVKVATKTEERAQRAKEAFPKYQQMEERIYAMGVAGPLLRAAGNPKKMVKIMRQGFYRDNQ